MSRPSISASVLNASTIVVNLAQVDDGQLPGVMATLDTLLPSLGVVQDLVSDGDDLHVLTYGPAVGALERLVRRCDLLGIEVRDLTPHAPEEAETQPYVRDTVADPDGAL